MRLTPRRLLAATATMVVATIALSACAQAEPGSTSAPDRPRSTPIADATPTTSASPASTPPAPTATAAPGTATPPESAAVELVLFETQNGTMRIHVPAAWTVHDASRIALQPSGRQGWNNEVTFTTSEGGTLGYSDGIWGDTGVASVETRIVEQIAVGHGLTVASWWHRYEDDTYRAVVAVTSDVADPASLFRVGDGDRLHGLGYHSQEGASSFASRADAEAYLGSPEVALALDVLATVELTGDDEALPASIGVRHEGTTYLPYTTRNGTSTFLVPLEWRIDDTSRVGYGRGGEQVWENWVNLFRPNGGSAALYVDYVLFQGQEPDWPWTPGEVRPTADGLHAVSYMLGDTGDHNTGLVGVNLSDQGDATRPTGTVCAETICRVFTSTQLTEGDAFFGGHTEEQLLTVIGSLERHHDDARMPEPGA